MKNKFLFLSATALLSTGLAMGANAVDEYDGDPTGTVTLKATAEFTSPIRVESEPIYFGLLDPVIGGQVTVNANTSGELYTGNAVLDIGYAPERGYITLYGGAVSAHIDRGTVTQEISGYVVFDNLSGKSITLIETGSATQENPNGKPCGTVTAFTEGDYLIGNRLYDENAVSALMIPIGATLTITPGYQPSGNISRCEGSTTVTYLLNLDF